MSEILAENLSGKSVMGSDGTELGLLYNITMDINSGKLHDLVVDPDEQLLPFGRLRPKRRRRFLIPVSRVQAVKDYIVVQR
ncbi:PRC-barrel domain-containing protein [Saliphagus sp. GCM10025308]